MKVGAQIAEGHRLHLGGDRGRTTADPIGSAEISDRKLFFRLVRLEPGHLSDHALRALEMLRELCQRDRIIRKGLLERAQETRRCRLVRVIMFVVSELDTATLGKFLERPWARAVPALSGLSLPAFGRCEPQSIHA